MLQELTDRVRDLSLRLRPTMLDDLGLAPALLWHFQRYTAQTGVHVDFRHEGLDRRFSPEGETAAYRIIQEALTNVARHVGCGRRRFGFRLTGETLRLEIEDHGVGFDPAAVLATAPAAVCRGCGSAWPCWAASWNVTSAPGAGRASPRNGRGRAGGGDRTWR